jgi:hypothetical protein
MLSHPISESGILGWGELQPPIAWAANHATTRWNESRISSDVIWGRRRNAMWREGLN